MMSVSTLHFVHSFIPFSGGTTTRMCALLRDDSLRHHLVTLRSWSSQKPGSEVPPEEDVFGHISVRRVDYPVGYGGRIPGLRGRRQRAAFISAMVEAARGVEAKIVHGHNPSALGEAGLEVARATGRPFIYEIHKLAYDSVHVPPGVAGWQQWMRREQERRREGAVARAADVVIVQTDEIKQRVMELFAVDPERIHVMPMGVEPDLFDPRLYEATRQQFRREYGCTDRVCFLYNGLLSRDTGIDFFLETVRRLPPKIKAGMKVIILGRGPLQSTVERASAEEPELVRFLGLRDYSEMPAVYSACDVHALPYPDIDSCKTNVPTKLLEGMAMKRLILASDVEGTARVLGDAGVIYRAEDSASLSGAIEHVVQHYDTFEEHRARARQMVVEQYNWQYMREQLHAIYQQLAETQSAIPA